MSFANTDAPGNLENDAIQAKIDDIRKRLATSGPSAIKYEQLGDLLQSLDKSQEALTCYLRAEYLSPSSHWPRIKASRLFRRSGIAGRYEFYPDITNKRQAEGGLRLLNGHRHSANSLPLVSIVTVVYNNSSTLQRCINSVKSQNYPNIEYILIDGGSATPTMQIIANNADFIDYFISEPDEGVYAAMNKGIQLAHGDYICLLNSDDLYFPGFISDVLAAAREHEKRTGKIVDIVYTDYLAGDKYLEAQPISNGIYFGHLNICHNTFLARKEAYDIVGLYDEKYKIVSDAVWMRKAFEMNLNFISLNKTLFKLEDGGLSSGSTEYHRELFINEAGQSYRERFPQLAQEDAEKIYLFRFNKARIAELLKIATAYQNDVIFKDSLKSYVSYCFRARENFRFDQKIDTSLINDLCSLVNLLNIELRHLQITLNKKTLSDFLDKIDQKIALRKESSQYKILHFVSVFSAPSETFIYDLLLRLEAKPNWDNFILYEHQQLRDQRPYNKELYVPWQDFHPGIGAQIYKYIFNQLKPSAIVAHFAINEKKLSERIADLGLDIPTLSMCHGIDAFSMRSNPAYKDYIVNHFSRRNNTAFTAVSEYLARELMSHGVPSDRISLVHNSINPRFWAHRKQNQFYDANRPLKILSVGRLVKWKGHSHLISAVAEFCTRCTRKVELTIVYGNISEQLNSLKELADKLGIKDKVVFKEYVNFDAESDYYSRFDIFVFPSTYSEDIYNRSETFGVALLEAIASGLPVITSDAGGLPEVIGDEETPFAKVVAHSSSSAIYKALEQMWREQKSFADNIDYASKQLSRFSEKRQIHLLEKALDKIIIKPLKVAMFSTSTIQGAGYAAYRLHQGFLAASINSTLYTTVNNHQDQPGVVSIPHPSGDPKAWSSLQREPKPGMTIMTTNQTHIPSEKLIKMVESYDIINLHWHARFLSVENVASLTWGTKPVVMTIRDMMPITGGCHYFHGCEAWRSSCAQCPQISDKYSDYPSQILSAKRKNFNFKNLTLVALSNHSRNIIAQAPGFKDCRIEVIPNSIELDVFYPRGKNLQRKNLGLPLDRPIIAYVPSFSSEVKGYLEFIKALQHLRRLHPSINPLVLLIGNQTPITDKIPYDKVSLGYINDNHALAKAYSSADLVVVPSLEETFSNTAAEAIACGTPVVGFKTGAIPELAIDGETGYSCRVGDTIELCSRIVDVLNCSSMSKKCRELAEKKLAFHLQARKYQSLFNDLLLERKHLTQEWSAKTFNVFEECGLTLQSMISSR